MWGPTKGRGPRNYHLLPLFSVGLTAISGSLLQSNLCRDRDVAHYTLIVIVMVILWSRLVSISFWWIPTLLHIFWNVFYTSIYNYIIDMHVAKTILGRSCWPLEQKMLTHSYLLHFNRIHWYYWNAKGSSYNGKNNERSRINKRDQIDKRGQ